MLAREKTVTIDKRNCTAETALVGDSVENSIFMPDRLPPTTSSNITLSTSVSSNWNPGRPGVSIDTSSLATSNNEFITKNLQLMKFLTVWKLHTKNTLCANNEKSKYKGQGNSANPLQQVPFNKTMLVLLNRPTSIHHKLGWMWFNQTKIPISQAPLCFSPS